MARRVRTAVAVCAVFLATSGGGIVLADDVPPVKQPGPAAGTPIMARRFNEGPRQRAYLMEGTGRSAFPSPPHLLRLRSFFEHGVGQLHGFWYYEAERSFRQAVTLDPDCAMRIGTGPGECE